MKLLKAKIENYRSIKDITIDFEYSTKIFVGLSETGKSNILKALFTLKQSQKTSARDIREEVGSSDNSFIKFTFQLENEDKKLVLELINERLYGGNINDILIDNKKKVNVMFFLERNYLYYVDVKKDVKYNRYYLLKGKNFSINNEYCFITGTNDNPIEIIDNDDDTNTFKITNKVIVNKNIFNIGLATPEEITPEKLNTYLSDIVAGYFKSNEFNVLFWKYDESNILPSEINTEEFVKNPDKCVPLRKIFELYGITDIKKEYDSRKSTTRANSFDNLLTKISKNVTSYFRKKWVTMPKDTQIIISESGDNMRISIKDSENKFDMSDRSDGYKRLISFIIMISIDNTQSKLKNSLLLIDCPEAEIDVPSQKYLKDELIEIGKNNYVFYSTHSPYMLDSGNIYRHYLVEKQKEITTIKIGEEANYNDSAILFNSLGASLFENVNDTNLAFEGWSDKQLFNCGLSMLTDSVKSKLKHLGVCQLGGLRNATTFASTWELVCRVKKYVIISDDDEPAKQHKKTFFEERMNENIEWIMYSELLATTRKIETAEDFLQPSHIKKVCDEYIKNKDNSTEINFTLLSDDNKSKMAIIEMWLKQFEYDKETYKTEKNKIKSSLFTNLTKAKLREDYKDVLISIKEKFCS